MTYLGLCGTGKSRQLIMAESGARGTTYHSVARDTDDADDALANPTRSLEIISGPGPPPGDLSWPGVVPILS